MRAAIAAILVCVFMLSVAASPALAASGDLVWARRWDSATHRDDFLADMTRDPWGYIYVCGWTDKGTGSAVDRDVLLVKYHPDGRKLWTKTWNSGTPGSQDRGAAVACDWGGDVYVTGSEDSAGHDRMILLSYDALGGLEWSRTNDPHNADARGTDVVPHASGILVSGTTLLGPGRPAAMITWVYAGSALAWTAECSGSVPHASDGGAAVRGGRGGIVYVAGTTSSGTRSDLTLVKYDSGARQWVRRFDGTAHATDQARDLAVDSSDNVYVTGRARGAGSRDDLVVLKYSPSGSLRWLRRYDGPTHGDDAGSSIAISRYRGMLATTGRSQTVGSGPRQLTLAYRLDGLRLWARRETASGSGNSIWIAAGGDVYTGGVSKGAATASDFAAIKYSPAGARLWLRRYNRSTNRGDVGLRVLTTPFGSYVSGVSWSGGANEHADLAIVKHVP